ncbi:MAG: hypothetical protein FD181_2673 [Prolixibacteraceae bacterium]|nr:MAG: hypothetical protein FD181_2673 [Prolixibacteraceae bacterium]
MQLTRKQSEALNYLEDNSTNELLFGGAAAGGKSVLGCYWLLKSCLKFPGSRWLMGRSELKTLRESTLNTFFEVAKMQNIKSGSHYSFNQQLMSIRFVNGSEILLKDLFQYPSDPNFDSLGSIELTGVFVDECSQITEKAFNIVKSRIRYKLADFGLIPKILLTSNPSKNFLYTRFYKPFKEKTLPGNMKFIPALLTDNPNVTPHYRENLLQLDLISKERLLFGNWEYDGDKTALMTFDRITDIFSNSHNLGEMFISVDVARFGSDRTVIFVWNGLTVIEIITLEKKSVLDVSNEINRLKNNYNVPMSNIIADEDGVGGGIVDFVGCKGFVNNSMPVEVKGQKQNFSNLKSQCYFELADRINKGEISVKTEDIEVRNLLIQELEQVKRKDIDKDGKLAVIPKEKVKELIGRSPDYSDTLMMRMYFELNPQNEGVSIDLLSTMFH